MGAVGWVDSDSFDKHTHGEGHPECPERLDAIREAFARRGLESRLSRIRAQPAPRELLEAVHTPGHVAALERLCQGGGGAIDPDTRVVPASWDAAVEAAGAAVQAVDAVLAGTWRRAFCSVRPPGHHATVAQAMGFCLFDNVACAAEHALATREVKRVAILDWDVHHGNGTQDIFWERGDVLFVSWHQYPFYPGTGALDDIGAGAGLGATLNCPIAAGEGDGALWQNWEKRVRPALEGFMPELLLISAGFDADRRDPLGGLTVTPAGFERLSAAVVAWADANCAGRVISVLEGGYGLEALGEDVSVHAETLL
jgi:acetoin utilization deacetylase AcuC-like enzyme